MHELEQVGRSQEQAAGRFFRRSVCWVVRISAVSTISCAVAVGGLLECEVWVFLHQKHGFIEVSVFFWRRDDENLPQQ